MKLFKNDRAYENAHILLWLVKDTSWCHSWIWLGMIMVAPTLAMQLHITWKHRKDVHEVFHNLAVACWISANITWMSGEFFFHDTWRGGAQWFFHIGLLLMVVYYVVFFRRHPSQEQGLHT